MSSADRIEGVRIDSLTPHPNNPRLHGQRQVRQIAESIRRFGWTNPVLVDEAGRILAGHGRIEAARLLGLDTVPVIRIERMSEAEKRAYVIADNRLAERAGWDRELLAIELGALAGMDLDFDLEITGFDTGEIDLLIGEASSGEEAPVALPEEGAPVVSRPGDLWRIGEQRILCGDAREEAAWARLLDGDRARMAFTDPPYNVPIAGHVCGKGRARHAEFAMARGEMSEAEFTGFLRTVFERLAGHSLDGAIHDHCIDWRHLGAMLAAAEGVYGAPKNLCVWAKTNAGMGSFYRSQHELVFVFKVGQAPHVNTFGLGEAGRHRSNLWTYPGVNTFRNGRLEDLAAHPTVKPVAMVADAIRDCSRRGELVIDAFAGAGTTLLAAARTGRRGAALEIEPGYVDLALRRLEAETGEAAVHAGGESFAALAAARLGEDA